jgi:hypothetical protein
MIRLPRHLSPWAEELALFPEDIALSIGAVVSRLQSIVGGLESAHAGTGEPDGYDGIGRRGPYERLLASEWLLHDEAPDEFLRRVVASEHAFLSRAFGQKAAGRRSVALFDAGLDQLGAPRIAHLALLILLARRAARQGASFEWGVFQDGTLHAGVSESTILELLRARSTRRTSNADIERWMAIVGSAPLSELWCIGHRRVAAAERHGARTITVADVLEPGPQRIEVASRGKRAILDLPPAKDAVRLLRDPFSARAPRPIQGELDFEAGSALVFSADGRWLYLRGDPATLITVHVPGSPAASARAPVAFRAPPGQRVVAVGRRRRTVAVTVGLHGLQVHVLSKRGASASQTISFDGDAGTLERGALRPLGLFDDHTYGLVDEAGDLLHLREGGIERVPSTAVASRPVMSGLAFAERRDVGPPSVTIVSGRAGRLEMFEATLPPEWVLSAGSSPCVFGRDLSSPLAFEVSPRLWRVFDGNTSHGILKAKGGSVVGLAYGAAGVCLIVRSEDRLHLDLEHRNGTDRVVTTQSPITSVATSTYGHQIGIVTERGEVSVYDSARALLLARVRARPPR